MPIVWTCPCGKTLRVADEHAGRQVKCPGCSLVSVAREDEPTFEIVEDTRASVSPPPPAIPREKPVEVYYEDEQAPDEPEPKQKAENNKSWERERGNKEQGRRKRGSRDDDEDNEGWRTKGTREVAQSSGHFSLERRILSGGVVGGFLAMLIAAVWFVLGWVNGRIFFYPPVLFVIGLISIIKGVTKSEES